MASVTVYPAAAASGRCRFLVIAIGLGKPAPVELSIDGAAPIQPDVLKEWTSLRGERAYAPTLKGSRRGSTLQPGWSTLVEADAPQGKTRFAVAALVEGAAETRVMGHTLPGNVPLPGKGEFQVLLCSCYCLGEDGNRFNGGKSVWSEADRIAHERPIDLTILMGDQVYLDIPTFSDAPEDPESLANELERKYRSNFLPGEPEGKGFASLVSLAPVVALPDDHEYWNNAPHASAWVTNSYRWKGREQWRSIADDLFNGYQGFVPPVTRPARQPPGKADEPAADTDEPLKEVVVPFRDWKLEVGPLSFFFANTRSHREEDRSCTAAEETLANLEQWVRDLKKSKQFGVVVTGQSFLDAPAGGFAGKVADYALSNYRDFARFTAALDDLVRNGADALLLTGDVHWSRIAQLTPYQDPSANLFEVITSPASLVTAPWDAALKFRGNFTRDQFPRHSHGREVPGDVTLEGVTAPFFGRTVRQERGDVLCLLGFTRLVDGVRVTPRYYQVGSGLIPDPTSFVLRRRNP